METNKHQLCAKVLMGIGHYHMDLYSTPATKIRILSLQPGSQYKEHGTSDIDRV